MRVVEPREAIVVVNIVTKDAEQFTDLEAGLFGDLVIPSTDWSVGFLTKEVEAWSLVSKVTTHDGLAGFAYGSLERIGGTPVVLFGLISTAGSREPASVLNVLADEYLRRARISFPDEDVLIAARCNQRSHLQLFANLQDVCPVGNGRIGGEERAWGSRLAKRFQADTFDRKSMVMTCYDDSSRFDSADTGPDSLRSTSEFSSQPFAELKPRDHLIVWGWAAADYLSSYQTDVAV